MDQESPDEEDMVVVYKPPSEPEFQSLQNPKKSESEPPKRLESSDEESEDDGYTPIEIMYI